MTLNAASSNAAAPPRLTDGHVTLRAMCADDVSRMVEQCRDPESIRWTTVPTPFSTADAQAFIEYGQVAWAEGSQAAFAIEHAGQFGGSVVLRFDGHGRADIGVGSHPAVRGVVLEGRSVMERAVRLLLNWGFAARGLRVVRWDTYVGNWASRRLAWKVGFRFEGSARQQLVQRGELRDAWVGTLMAGEALAPPTTWLDVPVLHGSRVVLRLPKLADIPELAATIEDPATRRWLPHNPSPYTETDGRAWVERSRGVGVAGDRLDWVIADASTDTYLGGIDLHGIRLGRHGELGYLAHPEARGRGAVTEAVRLVAGYAFEELHLPALRASAVVDNAASRRVLEKTGFRFAGIDRLEAPDGSGWADSARYDLVPADL